MKVHPTSFGLAREERRGSHDAFAIETWEETVVAVLADGAGRSPMAREAAQRAVRSLVNHYQARPRAWAPPKALAELTRLINGTLHRESLERFGGPELITTLSVAVVEGDRLYGLNVGDSRVYLARGGRLAQLSRDHAGERTGVPHALDRAIGLEPDVDPHLFETELRDGDMALLCSDGVSNVLEAPALAEQLAQRGSARSIVCSARERATAETLDDMSAIVLDIERTGKLRAVQEMPLTIPSALRRGQTLDGFTLTKPFHQRDRIWLAERDGQRFALKFAPLAARHNPELLHLFVKETWNATRIEERNLFPRAFVPPDATARYYAMEFIEAPTLKTLLRSRRLSADETAALAKFLLEAAQCLLRFDLVHGDLKPENILALPGYDSLQFRLLDFGSVTEIFSVSSRAGTASYLAPERFHDAPISERTEIFALGATLYEALTRSLPFGEIERYQTPRFSAAKRPGALNPNTPRWLESALLRALSPDPRRRYQNYSEMAFDFAHPDRVAPFHPPGAPLLERNPLRFYQIGFYLLLALCFVLLALLLRRL